jgi:chorismate dehydratase
MKSPLRVGIVDFLNSRPLAWGFLQGSFGDAVVASYHPPARVADLLAAGEIDVGLIPSIEVLRIAGVSIVPGTCVAATREARSVLLLSRGPIDSVRRIAIDRNSRTSVALTRILLAEVWKIEPELVVQAASPHGVAEGFDAALLIGDPALRVDRSPFEVVDLAAAWRSLTGLPFVFAVWAAREGLGVQDLGPLFDRSLREGRLALDVMVEQASSELDLEPSRVRSYLTENLRFDFGAEEAAGLEEFYRRARDRGMVDSPSEEVA